MTETARCSCGARLVCTVCETCLAHCRLGDPVACAKEMVEFRMKRFGPDDTRTKTAQEQLEEAQLEIRAKEIAELSAAAVRRHRNSSALRVFRRRNGRGPKPGQKPN